jgi:hypothetical protein
MKNVLTAIDLQFTVLDKRSREFLALLTPETLYLRPRKLENSMTPFSCGEYILRSAAMVEQTFGGITTRLWDDPFEWTLPEKLSDVAKIVNYLDEVDATRRNGMGFFTSDDDLLREIPAPERVLPIITILLDTLSRARHYQGRGFAIFLMISDVKLPRL